MRAPRLAQPLALSAIALILSCSLATHAQEEGRCGVGKDLVVQALEHIKTGTPPEVEDGLQLLKHATEVCASLGDAWYYRSLFEQKLGQQAKANYSLGKAKLFGSEAMTEGANPFVLATPPAAETVTRPVHEKWALVVGISKFQDRHLHRLAFSTKDARDFAALLVDPNAGRFKASNIHALTDGEVTTRRLKQELNWLARSAQEDDLVVIFLSTHGTPRSKDTAEVNYLATSDTEVEPEDNLFATAMPMVELSDIVRTRIKARRTVIFLDTCHSGAATTPLAERAMPGTVDASASSVALDRMRQGIGRAILTSSRPDEVSSEGPPFQNGYFTHFLLLALRRNQGQETIQQVYAYLKEQLPKAAQAIHRRQTPVLSHSDLGADIVLGAPAGASSVFGAMGQGSPINH